MEPKRIGTIGESIVICEFAKRGCPVYTPFGDNEKIDLIVEFKNKLNRIQVKTVTKSGNDTYMVDIRSCKNHKTTPEIYHYTKQDIDYYAAVCLDNNNVCLIPVEEAPESTITIRFGEKPLNGQKSKIRYADEYTIDKMIV